MSASVASEASMRGGLPAWRLVVRVARAIRASIADCTRSASLGRSGRAAAARLGGGRGATRGLVARGEWAGDAA